MFTFDLTLAHRSPLGVVFTKAELPISGQHIAYIESIRRLEQEYKVRNLDVDCVDSDSTYQTELLKTIYDASYPLKDLMTVATGSTSDTSNVTKTWLAFWEVYARKLTPQLTQKLNTKHAAAVAKQSNPQRTVKKSITFRSFHVHAPVSVLTLQRSIQRVEFSTSGQINWDWISARRMNVTVDEQNEISKNPAKWIVGADGDGSLSVANLRSWKNTANVQLKTIDLIVSAEDTEHVSSAIFALLNCAIGGSAIIYIPRCSTTLTATIVHLFANCFESTEIIHTLAEDRLFLVGIGFSGKLKATQQKQLYELVGKLHDDLDETTAVVDIESESFVATLEKLIAMNDTLYKWRHDYYEKMLMLHEQLSTSSSAKLFTGYIDEVLAANYKDQSKKWVKFTDYPVEL